jgi:hypothetical protein
MNKILVDLETGEIKEVPMTEEEVARKESRRLALEAAAEEKRLAAEAEVQSRESAIAKLVSIGLTEDEARTIAK